VQQNKQSHKEATEEIKLFKFNFYVFISIIIDTKYQSNTNTPNGK